MALRSDPLVGLALIFVGVSSASAKEYLEEKDPNYTRVANYVGWINACVTNPVACNQ